jgi:hypothetical protein
LEEIGETLYEPLRVNEVLNGSFSVEKKSLKAFFWCEININGGLWVS